MPFRTAKEPRYNDRLPNVTQCRIHCVAIAAQRRLISPDDSERRASRSLPIAESRLISCMLRPHSKPNRGRRRLAISALTGFTADEIPLAPVIVTPVSMHKVDRYPSCFGIAAFREVLYTTLHPRRCRRRDQTLPHGRTGRWCRSSKAIGSVRELSLFTGSYWIHFEFGSSAFTLAIWSTRVGEVTVSVRNLIPAPPSSRFCSMAERTVVIKVCQLE